MNSIFTIRLLRDVMTLSKGKPPAQQPYFGSDAEIYLTPEYLRGNSLADTVKPSLNAVRVFDKETIILWDGSNAGEIFWSKSGILASTMSKITHTKTFDEKYFFYAVKNCESYIKSQTSGSGIPHVDKEILDKIEIVEFLKPEQSKIAEILSTVDKAIEQTEALIAKQQRIKTGLMQDLLTKGIDENGNLRSEKTHKFKDSPLGRIPEEWEVGALGCIVNNGNGSIQTGPFGSQLHAEDYKEIGIPIITVEHLSEGKILHRNLPLVGDADYKRLMKYSLREGDLVFSRVGAIDRCSYVSKDEAGWLFSGRCLRVRSGKSSNSNYLNYQLNYDKARNWILNNSVGSTMACLNTTILSMTPIFIPTIMEQQRISEYLDSISDHITNELLKRLKLYAIKTALMQDLLTGKVRVTPLLNNEVENE
ncbi:MAG: restriction endonuclease subunit S [Desulfamplus sp.]